MKYAKLILFLLLLGVGVGCAAVGVADCNLMVSRVILLANLPGDPGDMLFVLINEWNASRALHLAAHSESYQKVGISRSTLNYNKKMISTLFLFLG